MTEAINSGHLRAFVERIERLNEEKAALGEDIKQVYAEAKSNGFDPKILRKVIAINKQDPDRRAEECALVEAYCAAIWGDTPLGQAAKDRDDEGRQVAPVRAKGGLKSEAAGALRQAVGKLGKPVALTDAEKRQGVTAAFEGRDGIRTSIAFGAPGGAA